MPKAIQVHAYGGPEVMRYEDVALPAPGPGQIHVRQTAIGVNFIDIYFRSGAYKAPQLPFIPGKEGAGVIAALGEGVTDFRVGERVAYGSAASTYAEEVMIEASAAVHLADDVDDKTAAAMMLKGLTVEYLLRLYVADERAKYARSFYGVVDLLALLPTYLSIIFPAGRRSAS